MNGNWTANVIILFAITTSVKSCCARPFAGICINTPIPSTITLLAHNLLPTTTINVLSRPPFSLFFHLWAKVNLLFIAICFICSFSLPLPYPQSLFLTLPTIHHVVPIMQSILCSLSVWGFSRAFLLPGASCETAVLYWVWCSQTAKNHMKHFPLFLSLPWSLRWLFCLFRTFWNAAQSRLYITSLWNEKGALRLNGTITVVKRSYNWGQDVIMNLRLLCLDQKRFQTQVTPSIRLYCLHPLGSISWFLHKKYLRSPFSLSDPTSWYVLLFVSYMLLLSLYLLKNTSPLPTLVHFLSPITKHSSSLCLQNLVRGCSVLLGPGTSGLWRALAQSQNHIPGGGPAELTELLEQYTQNLAQNMKLTYLNPVALVAPNIGEFRMTPHTARASTHMTTDHL